MGDGRLNWITDFKTYFDDDEMVDHCKTVCMAHDNCDGFEHSKGAKACALMNGDQGRHIIYNDPSSTLFRKSCAQSATNPRPVTESSACDTDGFVSYPYNSNLREYDVGSYLLHTQNDEGVLRDACKDTCKNDGRCLGFTQIQPISSSGMRPLCMFHKTGSVMDQPTPVETSHTLYTSVHKCTPLRGVQSD